MSAAASRPLISAVITFSVIAMAGVALGLRATHLERVRARTQAEQMGAVVTDRLAQRWNEVGAYAIRLAGNTPPHDARVTGFPRDPHMDPALDDLPLVSYVFDSDGRVLFPDDPDLAAVPPGEWRRLPVGGQGTLVTTLGPFAVGQDPARLLAVAPVREGPPNGESRWVGVGVTADTLLARAGFENLGLSGYYFRLTHGAGGGVRVVDQTVVEGLAEPVRVVRSALATGFVTEVTPAAGWWTPGLRGGVIALVILLASLGSAFVYELARAPERAGAELDRLRTRLREVQHLQRIEARKRERAEIRLRRGAKSDPLTGLPKRDRLVRAVNRALRSARSDPGAPAAAVLAMDVDRLTEVADSLGEDAADELLSQVASRLVEALRPGDVVSRVSGGRFVALLSDMHRPEAAHEAAERVSEALDQPVRVRRHEVYTSVSIGMTTVATGLETAEDLLREAETALHEARRLGRGRLVSYDSSLREVAAQSLLLRSDLRPALEQGQFILAYQPIVSLAPGHDLLGMEVLVRWNHPREGMISPGLFIPIAEEDGFVVRLSRWISQRAARRYNRWRAEGLLPDELYLSVNISGRELHQPDLCDYYERLIEEHDIPEGALRLEVTERMLTDDVDLAARNLERLRGAGIKLMLDDFGTGYSSLSYLYQFRFDTMKIDRSFVMRVLESERERGTLAAIVQLAESLDMTTVAEGIEDQEIVPVLHSMGCSAGQGYLFARPLIGPDVEAYLSLRSAMGAPAPVGTSAERVGDRAPTRVDERAGTGGR